MNDSTEKREETISKNKENPKTKGPDPKQEKTYMNLAEAIEKEMVAAKQLGEALEEIDRLKDRIKSLEAQLKRSMFALEKLTDNTRARTKRPA